MGQIPTVLFGAENGHDLCVTPVYRLCRVLLDKQHLRFLQKGACFRLVLSSSCSMSLFLSALVISKKHGCFLCFLLLSPRAFHYTLGSPCSQGSEAKGNWDKLPLQTFVLLLPNFFSFPAGEVLPPTLLGLPGYSHKNCGTASCPLASLGLDLGSSKTAVFWFAHA